MICEHTTTNQQQHETMHTTIEMAGDYLEQIDIGGIKWNKEICGRWVICGWCGHAHDAVKAESIHEAFRLNVK